MKYKVGDRVRIKSLDWYNENKDKDGTIIFSTESGDYNFIKEDTRFCGRVVTIVFEGKGHYLIAEDDRCYFWIDEMIEGLVEEETKPDKVIEEAKTYWDSIKDAWICPEGYIFKDENGNVINATKIVLEKKKKEYPKTYEECCKILNLTVRDLDILDNMLDTTEIIYRKNLDRLLNSFRKLIICRDAYWKIAGEEMGLDGPWEPDFTNDDEERYGMYTTGNKVVKDFCGVGDVNTILTFPTEEMRDAFYENFKELVEQCKELL